MSTALVRDVLWRASTLLQDTTLQFYRNAERDMVDALNDGQAAISKFVPGASSRVDSIKLRAGTLQSIELIQPGDCKPGDGSTPVDPIVGTLVLDPICNMGPAGVTPGRSVRMAQGKTQDIHDRDWHASEGTAIKSIVFDPATPRIFYTVPGVHSATPVWLRLAYSAQPIKIPNTGTDLDPLYAADGASAQTITIADEFTDELVYYVVARMCMKQSEWADASKGAAFASMFSGSLNAKVAIATGRNPNLQFMQFAPTPEARSK